MLPRALGRGFWAIYDSMGALVVFSVLWTVCSLPVVTIPAATAALFAVTGRLADSREATPGDFFRSFRAYFWRGMLLGLLDLAAVAVILVNMAFYSRLGGALRPVGVLLAGLCLWMLVLLGMVQVFLWPLLVWRRVGVGLLIKRAVLVTLDNPFTAVGVLVVAGLLSGLSAATIAGFVFFGVGASAILCSAAFLTVAARYDDELRARQEQEPRRSFREVVRPWE